MKAKRICEGEYEYSAGGFTVRVSRVEPNPVYGDTKPMWVAAAKWRNDTYTDPLDYKSDAVAASRDMLSRATTS